MRYEEQTKNLKGTRAMRFFIPHTSYLTSRPLRGMTLIDVLVGIAIMLMVFLGLFAAFKLSIELVFSTKAKTGGVFLVAERLEHIRLLPYDAVGTIGGIPAGPTPQVEEVLLNGIPYTLRTTVVYVDDPADGLGEDDANGITADYKRVRVEATWQVRGSPRSTFSVTNIAPVGIESVEGGGTLRIAVVDALAEGVPQATVRVVNASVEPAIDLSIHTNDAGVVLLPGTPPASGYQLSVTKTGFSEAGTYNISSENPHPSPAHVSVVEGQTTGMTFAIDRTGALSVTALSPAAPGAFSDSFTDASKLAEMSDVSVSGGVLRLLFDGEAYAPFGYAFSNSIAPEALLEWDELSFSKTEVPDTEVRVRLYFFDGETFAPVPDESLPGNSVGFVASPIDISHLPPQVYGTLRLSADLETADAAETPSLAEWSLSYVAGPTPLGGVAFLLRGSKTIGTAEDGTPVYKYSASHTTPSSGVRIFDALEWDAYHLTLPAASPYAIVERCPNDVILPPDSATDVFLTVTEKTAQTLRVTVLADGAPSAGATVSLSGGAVRTTSLCGQAYFSGLGTSPYTLSVTKSGYAPYSEEIHVSGNSEVSVVLVSE